MQLFAVNFIPLPGSLYMFRAFYTPIIRSTILTVSTPSGTNHSIVSATFFQRGRSQFCSTASFTLNVSGVLHAHHQEYNFNCIYSLRYKS